VREAVWKRGRGPPFNGIVSRHLGAEILDWRFAITIGIPAAIVIAGWFLVHRLNGNRDLIQRRRDARVRGLEAAYLRLATASNRAPSNEIADQLELFVSEIQLYGTPKQINLMGQLVEEFKTPGKPANFDPLLKDLRDSLRHELDLEPVVGEVWWLRLWRPLKKERFRILRK
jgi:hypothetical protein